MKAHINTISFKGKSEDYFGNVNSIGPRGVYDEAKRFQEAITMAYHRFQWLSKSNFINIERSIHRSILYVCCNLSITYSYGIYYFHTIL